MPLTLLTESQMYSSSFLVADQLIVSGKSKEEADELVTKIWLALLDNIEDTKHTFLVLKSIAQEYDVRSKHKSFLFFVEKKLNWLSD